MIDLEHGNKTSDSPQIASSEYLEGNTNAYPMPPNVQPTAPIQNSGGISISVTTCSRETTIKIIKLICWLVMLICASVAIDDIEESHRLLNAQFERVVQYSLAISVIFFVIDIALISCKSINLSERLFNNSNMIYYMTVGYNAVLIFFLWVARVVVPHFGFGFKERSIKLFFSYQVFLGVGMVASAVELAIHLKRIKATRNQ